MRSREQQSVSHCTACFGSRKSENGSMLVEVTLGLMVFLLMALMFAAIFPMSIRAAHHSNYYAESVMIAQHKIDQLRYIGYSKISNASNLSSLEICDAGAPSTAPPYTVSFANIDGLVDNGTIKGFFPAGSTGTINVVDYSTVSGLTNPPPSGAVYRITINIAWTSTGTAGSSYSVSAFIIKMPHQ